MKTDIIKYLNDPAQLERLYRTDKASFRREFNELYPEIGEHQAARIWHERLNFEHAEISWGSARDLIFILLAAFFAGLVAKLPDLAGWSHDHFYPRNLGFVVFPFLIAYFARKARVAAPRLLIVATLLLLAVCYINMLPGNFESDTLMLACIHLPLFLWSLLGFTFVNPFNDYQKRIEFLRFNGELVVMSGLILIAGGVFSAITFGLFELIQVNIQEFYSGYVVVWGAASVPLLAAYLVQTNPELVNKVSPVIAKIFTPIVLVTLVIYLVAVVYTGKDPYNDREFLLIFNALLIGVMAIILFSMTGAAQKPESRAGALLLLALSVVTILVNGIALSAILFRISEWGITPNRLAVLGSNILILTNLLIVAYNLFSLLRDKNEAGRVTRSIAAFLPAYGIWAIIVTFLFPLLFGFQ